MARKQKAGRLVSGCDDLITAYFCADAFDDELDAIMKELDAKNGSDDKGGGGGGKKKSGEAHSGSWYQL